MMMKNNYDKKKRRMRDGEMRRMEGENGANIMKRATEERSEVSQSRVMNHISIFSLPLFANGFNVQVLQHSDL